MYNNISLSVDQNIALTGGKLSVYTQLYRLDQYSPHRSITYNSRPINITYIQLSGGLLQIALKVKGMIILCGLS